MFKGEEEREDGVVRNGGSSRAGGEEDCKMRGSVGGVRVGKWRK